jgi:DNA-binding MarR family transcriptional regulator
MPTIDPRTTSPSPSELPEVLQFMQVLWAVAHGLARISKRMNVDFGVTGPQRLVLRVVGLFPGMSAGELASILHVHPSTLTGILRRLVTSRLLYRVEHSGDRRRSVLALTGRGKRVNALGRGTAEAAVASALDDLSPRDQAAAKRVLRRIARHLVPGASPRARAVRPRRRMVGKPRRT